MEIFLVAIDCLSRNQDKNEYNNDEKISGRNSEIFRAYTDFKSQHQFIGCDQESGH